MRPSPMYRLWTSLGNRGSIATAAHVKKEAVATLVAANYETATELKFQNFCSGPWTHADHSPTCQVAPASLPTEPVEAMTLRVTIPFCCWHNYAKASQPMSSPECCVASMESSSSTWLRTGLGMSWNGFPKSMTRMT